MNAIDDLIRLLKHLPGMGEKSASRLAYHLIKTDDSFNKALGGYVAAIQRKRSADTAHRPTGTGRCYAL